MGRQAYRCLARAGLLGNPSDGYGGFVVGLTLGNWWAEAVLEPARDGAVSLGGETLRWASPGDFLERTAASGHRGVCRIATAAIEVWLHFRTHRGASPRDGFQLSVHSNIPMQVGLGGSSAIVIAVLRALEGRAGATLTPEVMASLALAAETDLLGIPAGPQDRVCQSLEGLVAMDFSPPEMRVQDGVRVGRYFRLDPDLLPPGMFVAWSPAGKEGTEVPHQSLRQRFDAGEPEVVQAMAEFARMGRAGAAALEHRDHATLGRLMDAAFHLRASIMTLNPVHAAMVRRAHELGAHAQYCGSGGAIVGFCPEGVVWSDVAAGLAEAGCETVRPDVRGRAAQRSLPGSGTGGIGV